jgi:hypothetical protein
MSVFNKIQVAFFIGYERLGKYPWLIEIPRQDTKFFQEWEIILFSLFLLIMTTKSCNYCKIILTANLKLFKWEKLYRIIDLYIFIKFVSHLVELEHLLKEPFCYYSERAFCFDIFYKFFNNNRYKVMKVTSTGYITIIQTY